jgi:hypothetical protein
VHLSHDAFDGVAPHQLISPIFTHGDVVQVCDDLLEQLRPIAGGYELDALG